MRTRSATAGETARRLVESLGGRFSTELGIDLDSEPPPVDEWFLAASLFGARISAHIAMRTYRALAGGGVHTVGDAGARSWDDLVRMLDSGGYARYDFRTATRLQQLGAEVRSRFGGTVSALGAIDDPHTLEYELDAFPGWGPTTTRIFLRELRGVWPGADVPLDERTLRAADHLAFRLPGGHARQLTALRDVARLARLDARDLEAALVRLALAHRGMHACPGGRDCAYLLNPTTRR